MFGAEMGTERPRCRRRGSLKFDERFVADVLSGRKRITIRKSKKVKPGDIVVLESDSGPFAIAYIEKVRPVKLHDLSDEIAQRDGFRNRDELLRALRHYYGHIDENEELYLIEFRVLRGISDPRELK